MQERSITSLRYRGTVKPGEEQAYCRCRSWRPRPTTPIIPSLSGCGRLFPPSRLQTEQWRSRGDSCTAQAKHFSQPLSGFCLNLSLPILFIGFFLKEKTPFFHSLLDLGVKQFNISDRFGQKIVSAKIALGSLDHDGHGDSRHCLRKQSRMTQK